MDFSRLDSEKNPCVFFLQAEEHNEVDNELANRMTLFYANATPMLKTLSDATTKFVAKVGVVKLLYFDNNMPYTIQTTQIYVN